MNKQTYREYFVVDSEKINRRPTRVYNTYPSWLEGFVEIIHVIEIAALTEANARIEKLRIALRDITICSSRDDASYRASSALKEDDGGV
jgi:hypothetical protein